MQHRQLQNHKKEVEGSLPNFLPVYAQLVKYLVFEFGSSVLQNGHVWREAPELKAGQEADGLDPHW
jgi:hypothetical protein